jgi:hypothetical protein
MSIFYDEERNVYIDLDTGTEIAGFDSHQTNRNFHIESDLAYAKMLEEQNNSESKEPDESQLREDHDLALLIASESAPRPSIPPPRTRAKTTDNNGNRLISTPVENELTREVMNLQLGDESQDSPPIGWGWEDWSLARALQGLIIVEIIIIP